MRKKEISCKRENTRDIIGDTVQEWGSAGRRVLHDCPAARSSTPGGTGRSRLHIESLHSISFRNGGDTMISGEYVRQWCPVMLVSWEEADMIG